MYGPSGLGLGLYDSAFRVEGLAFEGLGEGLGSRVLGFRV